MTTHSELIDEFNVLYPRLRINKSVGSRKIFDEAYDNREIYGEKFVDIERFNGKYDYQISNFGRVRTKQNGKWHILAPSRGNNGTRAVQPSKDVKIAIARTVLIAFGPKPVPLHGVPVFKNGDRFDCRIGNLGWSNPFKDNIGTFNFENSNDQDAEILKQDLFKLLCKSEDLEMCLELFKKKSDKHMDFNADELRIPVIEVSKSYKHPAEIQREVSIRYGVFVSDETIIETLGSKKLMQFA
jgi:hypothetical protein